MGACAEREESKRVALISNETPPSSGQRVHKLLLLGTGDSGKSTFFKQLTHIYDGGFHDEEFLNSAKYIQDSVITQMKSLLMAIHDGDEEWKAFESDVADEAYVVSQASSEESLSALAPHITKLWNDSNIQRAWDNRKTLNISDSAPHFFNNLERIAVDDYQPTTEDILLARIPTTGIRNRQFTIRGNIFQIHDFGGQRSERSKWISCFETVHAIVFVSALNSYDQMLYEENNTNAMFEEIELFSQVVNSRYFRKTPVILFLNKSDLFAEKISRVPLSVCFPDYEYLDDGKNDEFQYACEFLRDRFIERCILEQKHISSHITCATDRNNVERVFEDVQHSIVMNTNAFIRSDLVGIPSTITDKLEVESAVGGSGCCGAFV